MYKKQTISVVIPTYNEEDSIGFVIKDFKKLGFIDEIIVIDNNSKDLTVQIATKLGAKIIKEKKQGYGYACIKGLKEAKKDLIILVEGDYTFDAKDTKRFLEQIDNYDMIIGSRTTKGWYSKKSHMPWYVVFGNNILANILKWTYNYKHKLNDIGCTYRIIKQNSLKKFINKLKIGGCDFTPELTIEALKSNLNIKQIPIKYKERRGETKLSMNWIQSLKIGIFHLKLIINKRTKKKIY
ncbi:hypothetical protein CMO90_02225 [Candidatus Woesearchaeota archaeon]|jgi:glycosyltransferase involved in cell wall biosynthesis|nr:hypothetical protein [Candidatus Woesearchaeota archaeon]|tara:strand:+ start:749 stop:1465 length:717 start_codon:yes stop_codon:yes gene_type:complete